MIRITRDYGDTSRKPVAHNYRIANYELVIQEPVTALLAFSEGEASETYNASLANMDKPELLNADNAELEYAGNAPLADGDREVEYWALGKQRQINVAGKPVCHINLSERHIHLLNDRGFDDRLNLEVVTGPALIVLLARENIYCLHAGAVSTEHGNIAFIAESGVGKSTLSADLDESWRQLADDILPVQIRYTTSYLSNFPQLKLPGAQVLQPIFGEMCLDLVVRLNEEPADEVSFNELSKTDAVLAIVRHTVAARLYDKKQMTAHTSFAKRLCSNITVVELNYPRDPKQLPMLRQSIIDYLQLDKFDQ